MVRFSSGSINDFLDFPTKFKTICSKKALSKLMKYSRKLQVKNPAHGGINLDFQHPY